MRLRGPSLEFVCCASLAANLGLIANELQEKDPSVFRTETTLVRLDVAVLDSSGHAIPDLKPSDFQVRQDGKQRPVVFAEFRRAENVGRGAASGGASIPTPSGERRIVVVVDDMRMSFDSVVRVREELLAPLLKNAGPDDHLMIVGTRALGRTVAFTRDPATLKAQVDALRWEAPTLRTEPDSSEHRRTCMDFGSENTLDVKIAEGPLALIESAVSDLRSYPGRKIILLLADGISDSCPEYRWEFDERVRRLTDLASRSSWIIYGIQTTPFASGVRMPEHRGVASDVTGHPSLALVHNEVSERMRKLAEPTGGYAARSNSVTELVGAALMDSSSYYVLAYEPPPGTFTTGKIKYRRIEVRVSRRDATVRARAGFYSVADSELVR